MASHPLTRRTFIAATGAVVAGTLAACGGAGGVLTLGEETTLGTLGEAPPVDGVSEGLAQAPLADGTLWHLTRADFEGWTGETFEMRPEGQAPVTLDLVRVEDRSQGMTPEQRELGLREPFSVQFHAPLSVSAEGGPSALAHPAMGEVRVYVSDGGTTEDGEAVHLGPPAKVYELHFD